MYPGQSAPPLHGVVVEEEESPRLVAARAIAEAMIPALTHCRPESMFAIQQFVQAMAQDMGGTLTLQAPSSARRKSHLEAQYATEPIRTLVQT